MNHHPSHLMMPPTPPPGGVHSVHCGHCKAFTEADLAQPCPMVNAPSGLPQEPAPDPAAFEEYVAIVRKAREAADAKEELEDRADECLCWLTHCARQYARAKPNRRTNPEQFRKCAAALSRAASQYFKAFERVS